MAESILQAPDVDLDLALEHGLTEEEYEWILEELGRTPTFVELGIYSVMWSEHCSYKNSLALLKTLPNKGDQLLVAAGEENAGLVDIGEGLGVAFKIESHNHPSAVEPYQGAATGVGGIHRDIFTMGARPICALNSLRFGSLDEPRVRYLFDGVVRGIGDYGNSFGVPTVAGEVYFDEAYEGNPLVNAMSVGIVDTDKIASASADEAGCPVYIVGSSTGRDGIHGATFASEEISEESEEKRPSVQVGDPFQEKLLLEATLEALKEEVVAGIQDMGAAGITSSSFEMTASSGTGMDLHLDRVPVRESKMTPYEIMLSESQERMLIVCKKGREEELKAIFKKWDLNAKHVGEVTDTKRVRIFWNGDVVADLDPHHLAAGEGAPVYERETKEPTYLNETRTFDPTSIQDVTPETASDAFLTLLEAPNIASKRWVFEQYDTMVRTNTVVGPGPSDAAIVRVKGTDRGLAVKTDCNGRYVYLNPRRGAQIAVAEAARNVTCAGGKPMAITNCLNFGNPYKPEVYWTFEQAIRGMSDACTTLETPVTGGNVSLYNEHPEGAVFPTPTIGMLGVVDDVAEHSTTSAFQEDGDVLFLLSPDTWAHRDDIGGSEYLATLHGMTAGDAPYIDLEEERAVQNAMLTLIRDGIVQHAHDVSDGGLAIALAESAIHGQVGGQVDLGAVDDIRADAILFGEAQSRITFSTRANAAERVKEVLADIDGVSVRRIGEVGGANLKLTVSGSEYLDADVGAISDVYENAIPKRMNA
ncbi:phosphoribosylformylglycinamidine synthase II [Longibacter salinarum]|uniref:Phosphoribosylformylglycinamidine synthase subunit PurL n=1 Tax=Longibacter salinarum TaxID=1850348 RepID=A0A2A8CV22_9BACT|nr:phosphoribosylformylglycinamidine synthase subunit PurL [Longibacter salinarum]PEN12304.1 phosphoribosylformylglycinamidine synthase II [Longibacter salinarum]